MSISLLQNLVRKISAAAQGGMTDKMSASPLVRFMDVIYDDWHGIKRPIGIVHEMRTPNGQIREVLTFCGTGPRQPEMALFVKARSGNGADDVSLTFEDQELIPSCLRKLPCAYKDAYLRGGEPPFELLQASA